MDIEEEMVRHAELPIRRSARLAQSEAKACEDDANVFGLVNTGVICYFNSLMQALISCRDFVAGASGLDSARPVAKELIDFLSLAEEKAQRVMSVAPILGALRARVPTFGQGQEDVAEGFDLLIGQLGPAAEAAFRSEWRVDIYCLACRRFVSNKMETILRMGVERDYMPLWESAGFSEFLSGYLTMVAEYKCPKCGEVTNAGKSHRLVRAPAVMVISLNKYHDKWMADAPIAGLAIRYGLDRELGQEYELSAIVRHYGNREGGHYNAIVRRGPSVWLADDAHITASAMEPTRDDYMLFYSQKKIENWSP